MKILLDTNALLWAIIQPGSLSRTAADIIDDSNSVVLVSAASAWEIATKVRRGKLPRTEAFERDLPEVIERVGFILIPIDAEVALRAGRLIGEHRDPFDRVIAAYALALDIPVVSIDAKLDAFGVRRIW